MPKNKRSWVWEHFTPNPDGLTAVCKLCKDSLNNKGSTTCLTKHLNTVHSVISRNAATESTADEDDVDNLQQEETEANETTQNPENASEEGPSGAPPIKRRRRTSKSTNSTVTVCPPSRVEAIDTAVTKLISGAMLPLSLVDNNSFIEFVRVLEPGYKLMCSKTLSARLQYIYDEAVQNVKQKLNDVDFVALSSDCWTSRAQDAYITISAYYIDSDWTPQTYTLSTQLFDERHTASNLAIKLEEIIRFWNLEEKVIAIVTDNAANILGALKLLTCVEETSGVSCNAHTMQLAINAGLETLELKEIIKKSSRIVGHFHHSGIASTALQKSQKQVQLKEKKLVQSCKTRWNITLFMFGSLLESRSAIENVLAAKNITTVATAQNLEVTESEWITIENIVQILKPLQIATTVFCSDTFSPISVVRPIIAALIDNHLDVHDDDASEIETFKLKVKEELGIRFKIKSHQNDDVTAPQIASFLDPRYKNLTFENESWVTPIKAVVLGKLDKDHALDAEQEQASTSLDLLFKKPNESTSTIRKQFANYKSETELDYNANPFEWWKNRERKYPQIAKLAKKYLSIPSSSAGSERVFSTAGNLVSAKRSCLSPDNVDRLVFLYQNRKLM